jgi:hypothetical protein
MKPFSGKIQNFWAWDYSPQVLDYQDFQIIGDGIKEFYFIYLCFKNNIIAEAFTMDNTARM